MIRSIACNETRKLWGGKFSKKLPHDIQTRAKTRLHWIDDADAIDDLRLPKSNHLEKLRGAYEGYHSIRVNNQWRIVFAWVDGGAERVAIVDYH